MPPVLKDLLLALVLTLLAAMLGSALPLAKAPAEPDPDAAQSAHRAVRSLDDPPSAQRTVS